MIFGERDDLAPRLSNVSPPGKSVSDGRKQRFLAQILLKGEVTVQAIPICQLDVYVCRALIDVHRSHARPAEEYVAFGIGKVKVRNQWKQGLHSGITRTRC